MRFDMVTVVVNWFDIKIKAQRFVNCGGSCGRCINDESGGIYDVKRYLE